MRRALCAIHLARLPRCGSANRKARSSQNLELRRLKVRIGETRLFGGEFNQRGPPVRRRVHPTGVEVLANSPVVLAMVGLLVGFIRIVGVRKSRPDCKLGPISPRTRDPRQRRTTGWAFSFRSWPAEQCLGAKLPTHSPVLILSLLLSPEPAAGLAPGSISTGT